MTNRPSAERLAEIRARHSRHLEFPETCICGYAFFTCPTLMLLAEIDALGAELLAETQMASFERKRADDREKWAVELEQKNADLRADVERLRKRTHEIAEEADKRYGKREKEIRDKITPDLIHAELDRERRAEVHAWLAQHGADPEALDGRTLINSISHHTAVAVHELLRQLSTERAAKEEAEVRRAETVAMCKQLKLEKEEALREYENLRNRLVCPKGHGRYDIKRDGSLWCEPCGMRIQWIGFTSNEVDKLIEEKEQATRERKLDVAGFQQAIEIYKGQRDRFREEKNRLRAALEEKERELARVRKFHAIPTHGSCCTCQRCGLDHDYCRCDLDEVVEECERLREQAKAQAGEIEGLQNALWNSPYPEHNRD